MAPLDKTLGFAVPFRETAQDRGANGCAVPFCETVQDRGTTVVQDRMHIYKKITS